MLPKLNFCASVLQHDTFGFIWNCCGDLNKNDNLSKWCVSVSLLNIGQQVSFVFLPAVYVKDLMSEFNYDILESIPSIRAR